MALAQTGPCIVSSLLSFWHSICQTSCHFVLQEIGETGQNNYFLQRKNASLDYIWKLLFCFSSVVQECFEEMCLGLNLHFENPYEGRNDKNIVNNL